MMDQAWDLSAVTGTCRRLPDDCEWAFVRCRRLGVIEVPGDEVSGEREVVGVAATPGPHTAQDRLAIGGKVDGLRYDPGRCEQAAVVVTHPARPEREVEDDVGACRDELQQPNPQAGLDIVAGLPREWHGR